MRSQRRGRGEGCYGREELAQKGLIHLLRGFRPRAGWKVGRRAARGEPLRGPNVLGGGGVQEEGPVFVFRGLDGLEIARSGSIRQFP